MDRKNVFVPGLTDLQRRQLETLPGPERYVFHALLDIETVVDRKEYVFSDLLEQARAQLRDFDGSVDALVAHWDFPTSVLVPILAHEYGLPAPSLRSLLACENKYWSRLEQKAAVPECVPAFQAFDPFDDDALEKLDLPFPIWVKPVKSFSSQLGFRLDGIEDFAAAIAKIRAGVRRIGAPFDEVLGMVDLPLEVAATRGTACLAEQVISGVQAAPEGSMFQGEFSIHGFVDMLKAGPVGSSFDRLDYPSELPDAIQQRMADVCERFLRHVGFDNGGFNVEFMWDREQDRLWLIEVNARISQSHSDLFAKVDGASNHKVAIDVALGRRPSLPYRQGPFRVAAQCHISHDEDAIVTGVPSDQDIARLCKRFPGTVVELDVTRGDRLDDLPNQGAYRYELGVIYLGADSREELERRYEACLEALPFEFAPVQPDSAPVDLKTS